MKRRTKTRRLRRRGKHIKTRSKMRGGDKTICSSDHFTVGELIECLQKIPEDTKVYHEEMGQPIESMAIEEWDDGIIIT